jgi:hypothetical protein
MGRMKELYTQGVTDLHSYEVGRIDGRMQKSVEIIRMIQKALENPSLDIDRMPPRMAIAVLIGAIQLNAQEDAREDNDADIPADSDN